jgi:hypothetical protein
MKLVQMFSILASNDEHRTNAIYRSENAKQRFAVAQAILGFSRRVAVSQGGNRESHESINEDDAKHNTQEQLKVSGVSDKAIDAVKIDMGPKRPPFRDPPVLSPLRRLIGTARPPPKSVSSTSQKEKGKVRQ